MTAPDRIALRWEPGAAVTNGPLMTHPEYTNYLRATPAREAADDLLAALQTIALWREAGWQKAGFIDAAQLREHEDETIRAAIAKAKGETL